MSRLRIYLNGFVVQTWFCCGKCDFDQDEIKKNSSFVLSKSLLILGLQIKTKGQKGVTPTENRYIKKKKSNQINIEQLPVIKL